MTIYTLETETGNITAFPNAEAAAATSQTPFDVFISQQELAELIAQWPADRLLSTYNSLPGVQPLKRLPDGRAGRESVRHRNNGYPRLCLPARVHAHAFHQAFHQLP